MMCLIFKGLSRLSKRVTWRPLGCERLTCNLMEMFDQAGSTGKGVLVYMYKQTELKDLDVFILMQLDRSCGIGEEYKLVIVSNLIHLYI